jgi:conjugative relaxase-like TrwC/TraI family protein
MKNTEVAKAYLRKGLTHSDYYVDGKDWILGTWQGEMKEVLKLPDSVSVWDFDMLCDNINPGTEKQITERQRDDRKPFYDFTFSAPKSVSLLWATTDNLELRDKITKAMESAVSDAMAMAEAEFTLGREKWMGQVEKIDDEGNATFVEQEMTKYHQTKKLLYTLFRHDTSRPVGGIPDPHLHIHASVFNMTQIMKQGKKDKDGNETEPYGVFKAIEFMDFVRFREYTEAVFHSTLAQNLQELGIKLNDTHKSFEVAGISREIIDTFSSRTMLIEEYNQVNGITDADQKGKTGSKTREHKTNKLSEDELKENYKTRLGVEGQKIIDKISTRNPKGKDEKLSQKEIATNQELQTEKLFLAVDHAIIHNFERSTTITDYKLMADSLNYSLTSITAADVKDLLKDQIDDGSLMQGTERRQKVYTTKSIYNQEISLKDLVKKSKNTTKPIAPDYKLDAPMSTDQDEVFYSIMSSTDGIKYIKGDAGAGKTYLINQLKTAMEQSDRNVFAFAPTSIAGRKVLREEVTQNADTLKMLLTSQKLQKELGKDSVVFLDEAGMVGYSDMIELLTLRERIGFELILVGDTKQHASVAVGDALNYMELKAGLRPKALTSNRRQANNPGYLEAVNAFASKNTDTAIELLDQMESIKEVKQSTERFKAIATEYVTTTKQFKDWDEARKDILVVTPTHAESEVVTTQIRKALKKADIISKDDTSYIVLQDRTLSQAQKTDLRNYAKGDIIQFNQNVSKDIIRGSQWEVKFKPKNPTPYMERVPQNGEKQTILTKPQRLAIPTKSQDRYQVYTKKEIKLAIGDLIRMQENKLVTSSKAPKAEEIHQKIILDLKLQPVKQTEQEQTPGQTSKPQEPPKEKRIYKAATYTIKSIENDPKTNKPVITLDNDWQLDPGYQHLKHGYTSTSYSAQGRTVKHLIIAQSEMSNPAASFQQGYVSISRGKTSISLYTDDKEQLTKSYKHSKERKFAQSVGTPQASKEQVKTQPTTLDLPGGMPF